MLCDKCNKQITIDEAHIFAGYGYYIGFCQDCCPGELDGSECSKCEEKEN